MLSTLIVVLRLFHVVLGVFWAGSILFIGLLLFPSVRAAGPAGGQVMARLAARRMQTWLLSSSLLTILSGIMLLERNTAGFRPDLLLQGPNLVFATGGLFAILGMVVGVTVNAPTAKRLGLLAGQAQAGGGPPAPGQAAEIQRLQDVLLRATRAVATLLLLAVLAMAVARYVP